MKPATPGPMYDSGGASGVTKENTLMPAAVSQAGTNAAMPSSGTTRCDSQLNPAPRRAKKPRHEAFIRMSIATSTITRPVATMEKATSGPYPRPSPSVTATVITKATRTLLTGDRCRGLTIARNRGNAPIRPIAYAVRLDTFTPALALATVELTIARNTKNQNRPYSERARPSQDAVPVNDA